MKHTINCTLIYEVSKCSNEMRIVVNAVLCQRVYPTIDI